MSEAANDTAAVVEINLAQMQDDEFLNTIRADNLITVLSECGTGARILLVRNVDAVGQPFAMMECPTSGLIQFAALFMAAATVQTDTAIDPARLQTNLHAFNNAMQTNVYGYIERNKGLPGPETKQDA